MRPLTLGVLLRIEERDRVFDVLISSSDNSLQLGAIAKIFL